MQVGQAVVSSIDSKSEQKNELVSRSNNIDDRLADHLCRWSPRRHELAFGQSESVNFYSTECGRLALSRSVVGGRESRRSGGYRTITYIIVLEPDQLAGYSNNAALLMRVIQSMGALLLQTNGTVQLPLLEIPESCFLKPPSLSKACLADEVDKIVRAIEIHRQVILIGQPDPLAFLGRFLAALPPEDRLKISFATGLNVHEERPFNLQFFPESNPVLERQLASAQLRTIKMNLIPVSHC